MQRQGIFPPLNVQHTMIACLDRIYLIYDFLFKLVSYVFLPAGVRLFLLNILLNAYLIE
jgi:hypothetical protein